MGNESAPLPPPPTLSAPPQPAGGAPSGASGATGGGTAGPVTSSLPPPPTLALGQGAGGGGGATASAASVPVKGPLPPPPLSGGLPPPPALAPVGGGGVAGAQKSGRDSLSPLRSVHSTTEQIPPLPSAPNSGLSQPPAPSASTTCQTTFSKEESFQMPPNNTSGAADPAQIAGQAAPESGASWTAWAGTIGAQAMTTVTPAAGMLLEKAGELAYSTVESAGDLLAAPGSGPDGVGGAMVGGSADGNTDLLGQSSSHLSMGIAASMMARGEMPAAVPVHEQSAPAGAVKDNFAGLFAGSTPAGDSNGEAPRREEVLEKDMMATPDASAHPTVPAPRSPQVAMVQEMEQTQQHAQQTGGKRRAASHPPASTLASRQSRLPVLLLPTADAQEIANRNNATLSEMFRVFGNCNRSQYTGGKVVDPTLEPPLPPFRSAGRSMSLSWENIVLDFVSNGDMENAPVPEAEGEKGLGEAARVWDEDRPGDEEADGEADQLEKYVVETLAEDEEEEKAREADGVPSMASAPPARRASPVGAGDGGGAGPSEPAPFPERPEEALQSCSDAAFGLTSLPAAPWLRRFRHVLDAATDGMAHEMLRAPAVVILAASTSDAGGYVNCLAELANVHHLPRPYHDGRYDPNGLRREFLLLHDVVNGPKDFDETFALQQMRERFGFGCCSVLKINSLVPREVVISDGYNTAGEDAEWENADPCSPFVDSALVEGYKCHVDTGDKSPPIRGACLSPSDKRAIRRYVANMVVMGLVPAVERRIANLNAAVANAKKGVKNVIKSFWRKPKDNNNILVNVSGYDGSGSNDSGMQPQSNHKAPLSPSNGSVKYRFDTIESQTRLLADTLFLMRDYDAALSAYRLVKDDYKHDKAHLHYASAQEMMVLCMHLLDPSGRDGRYAYDVHHSIETALYSYTRASDEEKEGEADNMAVARPNKASHATRLATRLCLALSATRSLCEGKDMEMADLLASASSHETPLGAAVLLEQSSAHYYRAGMPRKYAFHMLMAGHMFRSAGGQERHAFRCFAASLCVYHGERWGELRGHLRTALAAQLYGMERYALSMQFYAKLIGMTGGGRVSVRSQQKFLNHILTVCRTHPLEAAIAVGRMNDASTDAEGSALSAQNIVEGLEDAVRHIEISNIGFPKVQDSSIRVLANSAGNSCLSLGRSDSLPIMPDAGSDLEAGEESVWQDMTNCAEAELRATTSLLSTAGGSSNMNSQHSALDEDGGPLPPSAHSGDSLIDSVIAEIDKEERDVELRERQKRKGGTRAPEVRAISEPLAVTFSLKNPLGLEIESKDMQLVASMSSSTTGILHTNEVAVSKGAEGQNPTDKKSWKFHASDNHEFERPQFLCQLPSDSASSSPDATVDPYSEPHFVVTKSSMKMEPNSSSVVSLMICPLVEGDLRILGVRFRLMGEVWIYHRFNLKGPLLQDTQINRSRRARGESLLLRSTVRQEMPSLKISITPDESTHGTVLQGQTMRWKLEMSNLGYAPASNIVLKTNAPWLNIQDEASDTSGENAPISCCIGPSGTLMRVPLEATSQPGTLQPGETIELPVAIRTSGGGRQDFYLLFRYELLDGSRSTRATSGPAPKHRWARKLLSVPVYPSITMAASLMPSFSNKGEHILSVELMNYRSDRDTNLEILMDKICIASRHFEIKQLLGQVNSDAPITASSGALASPSLKIGWQERVTLHYLVVPAEKAEGASVTFSNISFSRGNEVVSIESLPATSPGSAGVADFMCRERAHEAFSSTLESHRIETERIRAEQEKEGQPRHVAQIRRARTSLPEQESVLSSTSDGQAQTSDSAPHPTSLASLCPVNGGSNINIICCWSALVGSEGDDDTISGQHHLRDLLVRPLNKSKGCPLALTANFRPRVEHNFEKGSCEDIEVTIRNRLIASNVAFEFSVDPQSGFDFVGATSFDASLSGGEEMTVPLSVQIHSAGVYNLQSVRLTVLTEGEKVPFLFPLQWKMVVDAS